MVAALRAPAAGLVAAAGVSLSLIVPPLVLRPSETIAPAISVPGVIGHSAGSVASRAVWRTPAARARKVAPPQRPPRPSTEPARAAASSPRTGPPAAPAPPPPAPSPPPPPPPAAPPPPQRVVAAETATRPGNGNGDRNHIHTGPPGQSATDRAQGNEGSRPRTR